LSRIASQTGMDARLFLESEEGRDEVRTDELWARRLAIQAVPCFLIDGEPVISGAQAPESIAATLSSAR
jgi:predicted DsbA family dithiol-disulfide isomerase